MSDPKEPPRITQSPDGAVLQAKLPEHGSLEAGLYIVATPIGNLRDITLRALETLFACDVIFAEDTRNTLKLLSSFGISKPLKPYHDHNAAKQIDYVLSEVQAGKAVALVSDAGTPLISDPGFKLVRAAYDMGIKVTTLPGPSAPITGLVLSGLPSDAFYFAGFLPPKSAARKTTLSRLTGIDATLIFFETGNRIETVLEDMSSVLGDREAAITRELTKTFEEVRKGKLSELIDGVKADPPRGEIVLLVDRGNGPGDWDEVKIDAALREQIDELGVKGAANAVAEKSGWKKRDVYNRALALKNG